MSLNIFLAQSKYVLNKCGYLENEVQNEMSTVLKQSIVYSSKMYVPRKCQCSLLVQMAKKMVLKGCELWL